MAHQSKKKKSRSNQNVKPSFNAAPIHVVLLFLITVTIYFKSIQFPLIFDSEQLVTNDFFKSALSHFNLFGIRSIAALSFSLTTFFFDTSIPAHRIMNILIHAGNSILIYIVVKKLMSHIFDKDFIEQKLSISSLSFFAALSFAIHPVMVYGTTYLIQRFIILSTFFGLLSANYFINALTTRSKKWYMLVILFYFLSIHSKEHAVMLPLTFLFLTLLLRKPDKELVKELALPFLFLIVLAVHVILLSKNILAKVYEPHAIMILTESRDQVSSLASDSVPLDQAFGLSVINQGYLFFKYLLLWIFPDTRLMAMDLPAVFPKSLFSWPQTLGFLFFLAVPVISIPQLLKRNFKSLLFFSILFPWSLFFTELSTVRYSENFVIYRSYLWLSGCFILPLVIIGSFKKKLIFPVLSLWCLLLLVLTHERINTFRSPSVLWKDNIDKLERLSEPSHMAYRIYNNYGSVLIKEGRYAEAISALLKGLSYRPSAIKILNNLGLAYEKQGLMDQAISYYERGLEYAFDPHVLKNQQGLIMAQTGQKNEAIDLFREAIALKPDFGDALNNMGNILSETGRLDDSIEYYQRAIQNHDDKEYVYNGLGSSYVKLGKTKEARENFKKALLINPNYFAALINSGDMDYNEHNYQDALKHFKKAIAVNNSSYRAHYSLANTFARINEVSNAIEEYKIAVSLNSKSASTQFNLGAMLIQQNNIAEARLHFEEALKIDPNYQKAKNALDEINPQYQSQ